MVHRAPVTLLFVGHFKQVGLGHGAVGESFVIRGQTTRENGHIMSCKESCFQVIVKNIAMDGKDT